MSVLVDDREPCPAEGCDNYTMDGDPCVECRAREAYWRGQWEHYGRREYERDLNYAQDMRDAGRGHLLREDER